MERLRYLEQQRMKQEDNVRQFENSNNEGYIKIRKTVEEKVDSVLSDRKMLLKLSLLSLTESMRKDSDKYSSLIYHNNTSSNTDHNSQNYETASYGQQQQQYQSQDYISMLLGKAEKVYNKLAKELVDESINDYGCSISSPSSSLPLLPPANEEQKSSKTNKSS